MDPVFVAIRVVVEFWVVVDEVGWVVVDEVGWVVVDEMVVPLLEDGFTTLVELAEPDDPVFVTAPLDGVVCGVGVCVSAGVAGAGAGVGVGAGVAGTGAGVVVVCGVGVCVSAGVAGAGYSLVVCVVVVFELSENEYV